MGATFRDVRSFSSGKNKYTYMRTKCGGCVAVGDIVTITRQGWKICVGNRQDGRGRGCALPPPHTRNHGAPDTCPPPSPSPRPSQRSAHHICTALAGLYKIPFQHAVIDYVLTLLVYRFHRVTMSCVKLTCINLSYI
jgi:hypothetical protein